MSNPNNSSNKIDKVEKQKNKKENTSLLSISQRDFIDTKLEKDLDYFSNYDFESNIFNDFSWFLKLKNSYSEIFLSLSEYSEDKKNYLISQLKAEVLKINVSRNIVLESAKKSFLNNYDLNNSEEDILYKSLKKTPNWYLSLLAKYEHKRKDFLIESKIFHSKWEVLSKKKKVNESLIRDIKIDEAKFNSLSDEKKEILFWLYNFKNTVSYSDLDIILSIFSDKTSKNNLIKYFFDNLSYSDLDKYNLISPSLESKIYLLFKNELKKINPSIWENESKEIFNSLDKDDFFIDMSNLDIDFSSLLNDNYFRNNLINKYNEDIESISDLDDCVISKLTPKWQNEDINDSFISYVEKDESLSKSIRDTIKNLKENNIIRFWQTDSTWLTSYAYFKISKVDNWTNLFSKTVILENITEKWWIRKDFKWPEKKFWYQGFYDLLKDYSWEKSKTSNLLICTKKDLIHTESSESDSSVWNSTSEINSLIPESEKVKEIVHDDEINTLFDLTSKLDFLDPNWKNIKFKAKEISLLSEFEGKSFVYSVIDINESKKEITIDQQWDWLTNVSFSKFYDVFSNTDLKLTRIKQYNDFKTLKSWLESFNWLELWWKNNDKIISDSDKDKKEINDNSYVWIKYFVWDSWEAIYVHEISNDNIEYSFWEVTEWEDPSKDKYDFKNWYNSVSFTQFFQDIKKYNMKPKLSSINNKTDEEINWEKKLNWSFFSRFLSWMSIADLMLAAKFFPDNIKKNMERWNKLKALKFAQKVASISWSESSFYLNMKSAAEQEEKNLTEEIVWNLKSLWSKDMIKQVKKILLNKDSQEYELIAAMMCIVWKYWTLYPKDLKEFSWSMIWYRRLKWTDSFLYKEKERIKNLKSPSWRPNPVFFNEERLVESWLWERSKAWNIRSRIDKDFWNALAWGIKEEMDDWAMKAWNKVTIQWRVDYFVWELKNLWYPNALWSLEKIFWKNWPSQDMNAAPFILTITWLWEKLDQVLLNKIVWVAYSTPFSTLAFNWSKEDIKLYQDYILAVIDDKYGSKNKDKSTSWMKSAYKKLLDEKDSSKKVGLASDFWSNYGKYLINHINLSDPYTILRRNNNNVYNKYFEKLKWIHSDWEFSVSDDDINYWVYDKNPIAYTSWALAKIKTDTTWGLGWPISKSIYNMYLTSIEKIKEDKISNKEEKKQLFKETFWTFSAHIKDIWWRFSVDSKKWNPLFDTMEKRLWVTIQYDELYPNREIYLDIMFERFINFKNDFNSNNSDLSKIESNVKKITDEIMFRKSSNDDNYKEAA